MYPFAARGEREGKSDHMFFPPSFVHVYTFTHLC